MRHFNRRGLTPAQWNDWMVYLSHVPLPADRDDANHGLRRYQAAKQAGAKRAKPKHFVIAWGPKEKRPEMTPEEIKQAMMFLR